jgi:8-oxo-dGTP pyrophosphatase MutT (NUDIX family)
MKHISEIVNIFFKKAVEKPKAVCALITRDGKILGVTRRGTKQQWGLPGGKVDPGESLKEALVREVFEETGVSLSPDGLEIVFTDDDGPYEVSTFRYSGGVSEPEQGDAGVVGWVTWDELLEGPFADYNARLLNKVSK